MIWYSTTHSHDLNQCWLLDHEALWHSQNNSTESAQAIILYNEFENYTFEIIATSPRAQRVNQRDAHSSHKLPAEHWLGNRAEYFMNHDDVIKGKQFPRYWPFVRGIHRSPVNSPHKGQWRGALIFTLICARINGWVNNREAGDLRRHCAHHDVIVMTPAILFYTITKNINHSLLGPLY